MGNKRQQANAEIVRPVDVLEYYYHRSARSEAIENLGHRLEVRPTTARSRRSSRPRLDAGHR
jgi:hypothetical protein